MGLVYSYRFLNGHLVSGPMPFIVPAGFTAVVRDLDISFPPTTGNDAELVIAGATVTIVEVGVEPAFTTYQWRGRQVAVEGEIIQVSISHNADFALSGYLLSN